MDVEMVDGVLFLQKVRQVKERLPRLYSFCVHGKIPRDLANAVGELHTWLMHIHPFIAVVADPEEESS